MGLGFRICLLTLICISFLAFSLPAEAGYWQQEAPYMVSYDDKPCYVQKQWNSQGWLVRIDDFSSTHVTFGTYHDQVQPSWSKVKAWWQAPPAVLYPGQNITLQFGAQFIAQSNWTEAFVWLYRMSGPGGGDDNLGSFSGKTSGTYTTKVHTVPEGFNGPAPEGVRLKYQMGATAIATTTCKAVFPYRWVPDGNAPSGGSTTITPPPAVSNSSNLALNRPAQQSSVYTGTGVDQSAHIAVDGKTSGRDPHDLIMTTLQNNPWWMVDLGRVAEIEQVRLYNRRNPDVNTCLDIEVLLSSDGNSWRKIYSHNRTPWDVLNIPASGQARFVKVQLPSYGGISLYEVEVIGR